jgi:NADPH:quinone reductase-like Zn-dependent oxidoreductase
MREFVPLPSEYQRLVIAPDRSWRLERARMPDLDPHDLLFRLLVAGVREEDRIPSPGSAQGALVGEIAAVGDAVTRWSPLDRALLIPGSGPPGTAGIAEFFRAGDGPDDRHGFRVFRIPERMNAEDATLLPSAALAARILRKATLPKGGRFLVVGLGLVGQILILLARHQRVEQILAADSSATLRAKAEWSGATGIIHLPEAPIGDSVLRMTGGQGVDGAAILSPDASWTAEASRVIAERGSLLVVAEFPPGFSLNVAPAWIQRNEIRIQGVRGFRERDLREAIRAIDQGILNAEGFISRRIPWPDLEGATLDPGYWAHGTHVLIEGPE